MRSLVSILRAKSYLCVVAVASVALISLPTGGTAEGNNPADPGAESE
jgi:hypothetical protein